VPATTWDDIRHALSNRTPSRVAEAVSTRAAVALILRDAPTGLELLFIRRAEHADDPWSGQMAFPGGRAEPGEDVFATAVRETEEEIGVDLDRDGERLGTLDEVRAMARLRPVDLAITPFVFRLARPAEARPSAEVRSVHWLHLDTIRGPGARSTFDYTRDGTSLQFPCLEIDGLVIWGLTYRMFASLEAALGVPGASADHRAVRVPS
jgi:8-oxo-dGTP pyrophosphatase MutT (NUDIX family)